MSAFELRALLADASQNGSYFIDVRDREGLDEVARELGPAVAAIDLAGCRDTAHVPDPFAAALPFPAWFGRQRTAPADCLLPLSCSPAEALLPLPATAPPS